MPMFKLVREYRATKEIEAPDEAAAKAALRELAFDDFPHMEETDEFVFEVRQYGTIREL